MRRLLNAIVFISALILSVDFTASAQQRDGETFQRDYRYPIVKTNELIKIDGDLNEPVWSSSQKAGSFWLKYPNDIGRPRRKTDVVITYDDKFIYFGFTAWDSGKSFISTLSSLCTAIVLLSVTLNGECMLIASAKIP